ncbi:MAG: nitroreductase family deazaflavin-dependent oxidoreductase [Actinomycetota bacterium]|nr:nitroreductase family deazaflavin-dependent oxidoreductase [Actinomycetota bacterium]
MKLVTLIHSKLIKFNQTKIGSFVLGGNILLLETIGKKSNKVRKVPLTYVDIKNGYLVAASYGGRDNSPGWYYNIKDNEGYVTVNKHRYKVKSEIVKDEDSEKFWNKLLSIYPTFNIYRARTERKIPLIKLIKV